MVTQKSTEKGMAIIPFPEIQGIAQAFFESGLFPGIKKQAEAVVKIVAGQELGFPPMFSMNNIDIVQGKVRLNSQVLATLVKRSGTYDYVVRTHTDKECVLAFTKDGQGIYESIYTISDAQRAGLVKPASAWVTHPKSMLFARAISQGARIACPHLIAGAETMEDAGLDEVDGEVSKEGEPLPSTWAAFWATTATRGFTEEEVHAWLGVKSVRDWLAEGKTFEQALDVLMAKKSLKDIDTMYGTAHTVTLPQGHEVKTEPVIVVAKEDIIHPGNVDIEELLDKIKRLIYPVDNPKWRSGDIAAWLVANCGSGKLSSLSEMVRKLSPEHLKVLSEEIDRRIAV